MSVARAAARCPAGARHVKRCSLAWRGAAAMPAAALAVHQLRYELAFGSDAHRQLAIEGHGYLGWVTPAVIVIASLALGGMLGRVVAAWRRGQPDLSEGRRLVIVWLATAFGLLLVYTGQELVGGAGRDRASDRDRRRFRGGWPVGDPGVAWCRGAARRVAGRCAACRRVRGPRRTRSAWPRSLSRCAATRSAAAASAAVVAAGVCVRGTRAAAGLASDARLTADHAVAGEHPDCRTGGGASCAPPHRQPAHARSPGACAPTCSS